MIQEQLIFANKTEFEADIIIDFLNQEGISYKTKISGRMGIVDLYDIYAKTDLNHYLFIKQLSEKKLEPYLKTVHSFYFLPCYQKEPAAIHEEINTAPISVNVTISQNTPISELDKLHKQLDGICKNVNVNINKNKPEPKKSMFLRLLERMKREKNV